LPYEILKNIFEPASRLLHYFLVVSIVEVVSIGATVVVVSIGAVVAVSMVVVVVVSALVEVSELLLQAVTIAAIAKIANNFFMCLKFLKVEYLS
jgi:hypothetical protein